MTEVVLAACSGGIVNLTLIEDLRGDTVKGDAKELADIALFEDRAGVRPTKAQYEADFEAAFATGRSLWSAHADELEQGMDPGRLRERLLGPFLSLLGYNLQYQRSHLSAGEGAFRITHLGWDGEDAPPMILDPSLPDVRDERQRRSSHDEMQAYLNESPKHTWGIVSDGRVLRLVRDFHHTRTKGYVEFELAHIFEAGSVADFLALFRVCHASRFSGRPELHTDGGNGIQNPHDQSLLELLYHRSVSAGVAAGKRLQPQVRRAIEHLANGALAANPELRRRVLEEAGFGRELYRELLTVLYRILFLLFAEQREMLHGNRLYEETYSMVRLRKTAETNRTEGRRFDLWEGLKATFSAFHEDALSAALGVYPYNGELFDPLRTPHLGNAHITNTEVAIAIRSLTTVEVNKMTLYVDYRNLGVEELGTVYESLLDYRLRINDSDQSLVVKDPIGERVVGSGLAYLAPMSLERGDLASYYTPPALVSLVLDKGLDLLLVERLEVAGSDPAARAAAILDLRIIDPACGSGAFLAEALERLAVALAKARSTPSEPSDIEVAAARRDVLSRCIYGADKDPFAVELCKVALWIHCAVPDAPLSFLDHHIVCGDSLVGWPMFDIPDSIPSEAFEFRKADPEDKKILRVARSENQEYLAGVQTLWSEPIAPSIGLSLPSLFEEPDRTHDDVREKATAFAKYRESQQYVEIKAAADLWTSAFFWTHHNGPAPTTRQYSSALNGDVDEVLMGEVGAICEPLNPLHWALAFPDVRERGGFDLVIGNPPWSKFTIEEREFFATKSPELAFLNSGERKERLVQLETSNPALHLQWITFLAAQGRLSHYAKTAQRFQQTGGEANTYVLFVELASQLIGHRGMVGMVVSSGIAFDNDQSPVWTKLVHDGRVVEFVDMVNGTRGGSEPVFPAVADVARFCVLILGAGTNESFQVSTFSFGLNEAISRPKQTMSMSDLTLVAPRTRTLVSWRTDDEYELILKLHRTWPSLDFDRSTAPDGLNPWGLDYINLFHSSGANAKGLMLTDERMKESGFSLTTAREGIAPDGNRALPVYEGQLANRWDHRARTYEGYAGANKYGRKPNAPWVTEEQHADPEFEIEPRYWMLESTAEKRLSERVGTRTVIAFRDTGAPWRNRRSMRAALLFPTPATDRLPLFACDKSLSLGLLALLNSTVFDFLVRCHTPSVKSASWAISQCVAPPPSEMDKACWELARRLSATSRKVATAYGLELYPWDTNERSEMDAECDARVAKAYNISRNEYETVLDHFVLLHLMDEKLYGELVTRQRYLDAYDRLEGGT